MDAKLVEQYEEQAIKAAVGFIERVSAGQYQSIDDVANLPEMTKLVLDYCAKHVAT